MKYKNLPVYEGKETYCHECGRRFLMGEIIGVTDDGKTYCYVAGCFIGSAFENSRVKNFGQPMRFHDTLKIPQLKLPRSTMYYAIKHNSIFNEMMKKLCGNKKKEEQR